VSLSKSVKQATKTKIDALGGVRTHDLWLIRPILYQLSYKSPSSSVRGRLSVFKLQGLERSQALQIVCTFRGSIVVSIPACHAGDPGSIPGSGVSVFFGFGVKIGDN
jgi:hypothetical protein